MERIPYVIVGGGITGTTAAEAIRKTDPSKNIVIVSDEPYRLYSRLLLSKPNFFLKKIPPEHIWLKNEQWYADNNVRLLAGRRAETLHAKEQKVVLDDGTILPYEKLLLALGGLARSLSVPGTDKRGVFYLRTLDDAKTIMAAIKTAKHAVVIGSGFISFEMCEMLRLAGIETTVVLRDTHYWQPIFKETSSQMIEKALKQGGVRIIRQAETREVLGNETVTGIILTDGNKLPCDFIIIGIGITYPIDWLSSRGIQTRHGILTNEYLETNIPNIWAAGDCAEFTDPILDERVQLGNWVNAQMQGKAAGMNMAGKREPFRLVSFYTTHAFGLSIAFVGHTRPFPDRTVITRGSPDAHSYAQLFVKKNRLCGATLLNRTSELSALTKIIARSVNVLPFHETLADASFDLREVLQ